MDVLAEFNSGVIVDVNPLMAIAIMKPNKALQSTAPQHLVFIQACKKMTVRPDISQYYALKAAIEQLLGNQAWLELKECTSVSMWKKYVLKLIAAIGVGIEQSIEIRDEGWVAEVHENLDRGTKGAKAAKDIDDLLSVLSATLLRQVFLQIGRLPNRSTARKVTRAGEFWKLNGHRSVQYIQTPTQIEAMFWSNQQQSIGIEKQMALRKEHRASKSKLPFSKWCRAREH